MKDIVSYKPPFGIIGEMENAVMIRKRLEEIFVHRTKALNALFEESTL